jgi:DNA-binding transcriptional MocR family regulator
MWFMQKRQTRYSLSYSKWIRRLAGYYTTRHNLIVNRLVEAIKLNWGIIGEVQENT